MSEKIIQLAKNGSIDLVCCAGPKKCHIEAGVKAAHLQ